MKKNQIALILAFLIIIMGFAFLYYRQFSQIKSTTTIQQDPLIHVTQTIEITNPTTSSATVKAGTTALDLLKQNTKIETKGEGVNAYVVAINGRTASNTDKEYWAFYINGKSAVVGAGSYKLKSGDKILWKIEKFQ